MCKVSYEEFPGREILGQWKVWDQSQLKSQKSHGIGQTREKRLAATAVACPPPANTFLTEYATIPVKLIKTYEKYKENSTVQLS